MKPVVIIQPTKDSALDNRDKCVGNVPERQGDTKQYALQNNKVHLNVG